MNYSNHLTNFKSKENKQFLDYHHTKIKPPASMRVSHILTTEEMQKEPNYLRDYQSWKLRYNTYLSASTIFRLTTKIEWTQWSFYLNKRYHKEICIFVSTFTHATTKKDGTSLNTYSNSKYLRQIFTFALSFTLTIMS